MVLLNGVDVLLCAAFLQPLPDLLASLRGRSINPQAYPLCLRAYQTARTYLRTCLLLFCLRGQLLRKPNAKREKGARRFVANSTFAAVT